MAEALGITMQALTRWCLAETVSPELTARRGRPPEMSEEVKDKLRQCYLEHYRQWGPTILAPWAEREGLGKWSPGQIDTVIADLKEEPEPKTEPIRLEVTAPMVMWSEDGTGFTERRQKKELLVVQDEYSRYKVNFRLADGPARAEDVALYLEEAFSKHGAPLVLKHDGGKVFHADIVRKIMAKWGVTDLTSPPYWPGYNGKCERAMRDIKSYERAMRKAGVRNTLSYRLQKTFTDLNEERPRPVLKGRTAREAFETESPALPDRNDFQIEVTIWRDVLYRQARSRSEQQSAGRKAVEQVLSWYGLLETNADVSTNFEDEK
jgi:transposase InsO family protein